MLTVLPLRDAVERCDALYSIIESIARRPEEGNYVLRLENDAFRANVLGMAAAGSQGKGTGTAAVECLQFLFAVGYRRRAEVTEGDVPSDAGGRVLQSASRGPYYYLAEPDPFSDFEAYAAHQERLELIRTKLGSACEKLRGLLLQSNRDRYAAEILGSSGIILL